jgi:hypothetical protein
MPLKQKKIAMGFLLGLFLVTGVQGMTLFIPPEILFLDKSLDYSLQETSSKYDQIRVIKQNAVLRIKPKDGTVIITKLPLGALLEVEEELDDWLKISLPPDEDGFVITGYLHAMFTEKASIIHE